VTLPRVAVATCAQARGLDEDEPLLLDALRRHGLAGEPVDWDDEGADWSSFRLVVVRSTWDYHERPAEFVAWAEAVERVTRLVNPAPVLRWNTDKAYLRDLAAAGVPVVPTVFADPGDPAPAVEGPVVVKPAVSAGSRDTARHDDGGSAAALEHSRRLLDAGRTVMVQPYLHAVDEAGETALVHIGGRPSHAMRKGPLLSDGAGDLVGGLFLQEEMSVRDPAAEELAVGEAVLAALPFDAAALAYSRVDLLPGPDGAPLLLEVELTEPSLFLSYVPEAADRLAAHLSDLVP
jgi:glutathione synthase/RimK-type ligase-like ATP-grasp enzyme